MIVYPYEPLRHVRITGNNSITYILRTWDTHRRTEGHAFSKAILRYDFRAEGADEPLFKGEDYSPGARTAIDSDQTLSDLICFFTSCAESGSDYTGTQRAWARAEENGPLSVYTEDGPGRARFENLDGWGGDPGQG